MKKYWYILFCCFFLDANYAVGQLSDGSTAPDFTFTDINGNSQNLYTYLNQGKYVAIDVSATWCVPCWNYHNTGSFDSLYQVHDMPGTGDWKVIFFEGDPNTDSADLYGAGPTTQGNWVQGAGYTIIDPAQGAALSNFKNGFVVTYYPTLYMICPNKKVYQDTLNKALTPYLKTWEYAANNLCAATGLDNMQDANPVAVYPNPAVGQTTIYFSLNTATEVRLKVINTIGQVMDAKDYGLLYPGDQKLPVDMSALGRGLYYFVLSSGSGRVVTKKVFVD